MSDLKVLTFPNEDKSEWGNTCVKSAADQIDWEKSIVIGESKDGVKSIYFYDLNDIKFMIRCLSGLKQAIFNLSEED
jgi:hypothetical protein